MTSRPGEDFLRGAGQEGVISPSSPTPKKVLHPLPLIFIAPSLSPIFFSHHPSPPNQIKNRDVWPPARLRNIFLPFGNGKWGRGGWQMKTVGSYFIDILDSKIILVCLHPREINRKNSKLQEFKNFFIQFFLDFKISF